MRNSTASIMICLPCVPITNNSSLIRTVSVQEAVLFLRSGTYTIGKERNGFGIACQIDPICKERMLCPAYMPRKTMVIPMTDLRAILPMGFCAAAETRGILWDNITEFRLRAGTCSAVTVRSGQGEMCNLALTSVHLTETDLRETLARLCHGSVHTYDASLRRGYFTPLAYPGVRVGVAGRVLCENGQIAKLQRLDTMCIRLPYRKTLPAETASVLRGLFFETDSPQNTVCAEAHSHVFPSVLFYAPPGVGKTTVLRTLIRLLSDAGGRCPMRVCVIDTGEELCGGGDFCDCTVDVFSGYPHGIGMAIATRCFAPEVLICDEIGDDREAEEILHAQGAGVPLIATAHADTRKTLLMRPAFAKLYAHAVFSKYVRIVRQGESLSFCEETEDGVCGG